MAKLRRSPKMPVMDYIRSRVRVVPETGCWEWQGYLQKNGYSKVSVQGKMRWTHNVVCTETHGPAPEGHIALHSCHNRRCCAPAHLSWGTVAMNAAQAMERGAILPPGQSGSLHHKAKLHETQVRDILRDPRTHIAIAAFYGVDKTLISQIKRRKIWRHVEV